MQENDALADEIVAFFKDKLGWDVVIEPYWNGPGFQIETDAGASFTFEITGETRAEVAQKYFEHIRSVYRSMAENRRKVSWFSLRRRVKRMDKDQVRAHLELLDAWAKEHLQP